MKKRAQEVSLLRQKLDYLIRKQRKSLVSEDVLKLSQRLDKLIVAEMIRLNMKR